MKMTEEQLAARLNGRQYGDEITRAEEQLAKENGLVVIFGASDDLCEMRGAIDDEFDCYDGGEIECEEYSGKLRAIWCPKNGGSWGYETDLPHAGFNIYEDDILYCVGIVVNLKKCQAKDSAIKNGWIFVEDDLPKDSEKVLCLTVGNFYEILCKIIGGWRCPLTSQEFYTDFVRYWQPLPKLPERSDTNAERTL